MTYQDRTFWQLPSAILTVLLFFCPISILPAQTVPEIAEKAGDEDTKARAERALRSLE